MKFLSEFGFGKVIGIDGSISAVKEAKILKRNKNCKIMNGDFNNIQLKNSVSVCIDRSITHNNKKILRQYLVR